MNNFDITILEESIRDVPDFPKPGILFKDITPILSDPELLSACIKALTSLVESSSIDKVIGIDARGFIFGSLIASSLGKGFIPVRKEGKLPWQTESQAYDLEYGKDTLEINIDVKNKNFLLIDDLLATGGTAEAAVKLIGKAGGKVSCFGSLIELSFLKGRNKLSVPVQTLIKY